MTLDPWLAGHQSQSGWTTWDLAYIAEFWGGPAAAGASLDADTHAAAPVAPAEPVNKAQSLANTHAVTLDVAQRYLMAANDDVAAAHRLLLTTRVRLAVFAALCDSPLTDFLL
jgi:hypothetical protein